ncbi:MAG: Cysteine desulfurase NifS [Candidatus Anoxychlamydiales bacterium]|nr:Cysteine desulfurase NifS [Candidatus Anoxychlamydiales bacterium]
MNEIIYLDNNATTPIAKEVIDIMQTDITLPLNPSSIHQYGRIAQKHLINSRKKIADFLKVKDETLIFTSGGTESINMAIKGILKNHPKAHIITTNIDHACVYNTLFNLKRNEHHVSFVKTDQKGYPEVDGIKEQIKENTRLIVVSYVNSETGVIADIEKIASLASQNNIDLVVDGVAILGKEKISIPKGVSAMCFSAHKIHGPKGVGLCYLRENVHFTPFLEGGSQEFEKRAGTENLSGIIGFAKAIELLNDLDEKTKYIKNLRDHFENSLKKELDIEINGEGKRVCNTTNIYFKDIEGDTLLINLDSSNVIASLGSACSSGSISPSRVLLQMGYDPRRCKASIRFSFSRYNTEEEVNKAIKIVTNLVKNLKN